MMSRRESTWAVLIVDTVNITFRAYWCIKKYSRVESAPSTLGGDWLNWICRAPQPHSSHRLSVALTRSAGGAEVKSPGRKSGVLRTGQAAPNLMAAKGEGRAENCVEPRD